MCATGGSSACRGELGWSCWLCQGLVLLQDVMTWADAGDGVRIARSEFLLLTISQADSWRWFKWLGGEELVL